MSRSDELITNFFESLTDGELLSQDLIFVDQLRNELSSQKLDRQGRLKKMKEKADLIFTEYSTSYGDFIDALRKSIFETAFVLEDEVNCIIEGKREKLKIDCQSVSATFDNYFETQFSEESIKFAKYEEEKEKKERRWRELKHEEAILRYRTNLQQPRFQNPQSRVQGFEALSKAHLEYFELRMQFIHNFGSIENLKLNSRTVETVLDSLRAKNDEVQESYDILFKHLMSISQQLSQDLHEEYSELQKSLEIYGFFSNSTEIEEFMNGEPNSMIQSIKSRDDCLLREAMKYVEVTDFKANEIAANFGNFVKKIAEIFDQQRVEFINISNAYELSKAKVTDDSEDKLEVLNTEYEELKRKLSMSVHHIMLETNLKEVFEKLDELEKEYRSFHEVNCSIVDGHPSLLNSYMGKWEESCSKIFAMVDESKKLELLSRNEAKRKAQADLLFAKEKLQRESEEAMAIEEAKGKKGGKAPPKKDAKKLQAEDEELMKSILSSIPIDPFEEYKSPMGRTWLLELSLTDVAKTFIPQDHEEGGEMQNEIPKSPIDPNGKSILSSAVFIQSSFLVSVLGVFRSKIFEFIFDRSEYLLDSSEKADKDFSDISLEILEARLKDHYPLKGKVEVEIYQNRSSEITDHKKRYERETRKLIESNNTSTEAFNLLLEQTSEIIKDYEAKMDSLKQGLSTAGSLSKMQGLLNGARESFLKFEKTSAEIAKLLESNISEETEFLLSKYKTEVFRKKESYSAEEMEWYEEMMAENISSVKAQSEIKRAKTDSVLNFLQLSKQGKMKAFEETYTIAIEELAATEGSGKKFGRPRRLTQERLRAEMTKCEQAQEFLENAIAELNQLHKKFLECGSEPQPTFSQLIRAKLMRIRAGIIKYGNHIEAFKSGNKIPEFTRVTLNEDKFDLAMSAEESQKDISTQQNELECLGALFYQKEPKNFNAWVADIQAKVREEAQKIYIGPLIKFLSGTDKIPEYLRIYLEKVKGQSEEFRITCVRGLREICCSFYGMADIIATTSLTSTSTYTIASMEKSYKSLSSIFESNFEGFMKSKEENLRRLRPNLSNPSNASDLSQLEEDERRRSEESLSEIGSAERRMKGSHFSFGKQFLPRLVSNYEFLMKFFTAAILFEDFVKLPGDEEIEKKHLNLKTLMYRKQTGILVDTSSERSLFKEWPSLDRKSLNFDGFILEAEATEVIKSDAKSKAKGGKIAEPLLDTKQFLKTFRTPREKTIFAIRNSSFEAFKSIYDAQLTQMNKRFEETRNEEEKYKIYWSKCLSNLFNL